MTNQVLLTKDEVNYIKKNKKLIGSGLDGSVYQIKGDILYKFYHNLGPSILYNNNAIYDEEGVNISGVLPLRGRINKMKNIINYIDDDNVKLASEEALIKTIEKQKYIKETLLPQNIIKQDKKVIGCVYKKCKAIMGIYSASLLPKDKKYKICRRVIYKVEELLNNNIYPTTLAQKNDVFPTLKKDSNILLDYKLEPHIIDLDGISAFYTDNFSKNKYKLALTSLSRLILEILVSKDLSNEFLDDNKEEYIKLLTSYNIDPKYIQKFYDYSYLEPEELKNILTK